ncbi:hypothetical protein [uncultured Sphingomonas sp.]|uniref:hypothetical protein n=1 Tax=uncultured Sphingomonas sp. TaxID=158754 RepID=UPI0025F28F40|nr:hypothetical protein [uncultured Sphingomonas sp.]
MRHSGTNCALFAKALDLYERETLRFVQLALDHPEARDRPEHVDPVGLTAHLFVPWQGTGLQRSAGAFNG